MNLSIPMSLNFELTQIELCEEFGVKIKNELTFKYSGLKITFPEEKFHALAELGFQPQDFEVIQKEFTLKSFSNLVKEDLARLSKVGITSDKIKKVALLANYYAEKHYLRKNNESDKESELKELANQGIEFTIKASVHDRDQAKNLAFNHAWQRNSDTWKY